MATQRPTFKLVLVGDGGTGKVSLKELSEQDSWNVGRIHDHAPNLDGYLNSS
jgi:hypothetical protein